MIAALESQFDGFRGSRPRLFQRRVQHGPLGFGDQRLDGPAGELAIGPSEIRRGLEVDVKDLRRLANQQDPVARVIADQLEIDEVARDGAIPIPDGAEMGESRRKQRPPCRTKKFSATAAI